MQEGPAENKSNFYFYVIKSLAFNIRLSYFERTLKATDVMQLKPSMWET